MGVFEECLNPLCKSPVTTHPKAVQPRRYCRDRCKMDTWALRRVSRLLLPLGSKGWEVLQNLENGDSGDKAEASMATVPLTSSTYPKMNFSFPDG